MVGQQSVSFNSTLNQHQVNIISDNHNMQNKPTKQCEVSIKRQGLEVGVDYNRICLLNGDSQTLIKGFFHSDGLTKLLLGAE